MCDCLMSTRARGEEDFETTLAVGEEDPLDPAYTTRAVGEECVTGLTGGGDAASAGGPFGGF